MQHAQKQKCNEVRSFCLGGRLSPVLDKYLAASSGLRGAQNWEGQRQKWRRIKVSRIVCFCAHSHEVLRVQPISAKGSKTARLHLRVMECCSKRGTQAMPLSQVITLHLCMSFLARGLAYSSFVSCRWENPYVLVSIPSS